MDIETKVKVDEEGRKSFQFKAEINEDEAELKITRVIRQFMEWCCDFVEEEKPVIHYTAWKCLRGDGIRFIGDQFYASIGDNNGIHVFYEDVLGNPVFEVFHRYGDEITNEKGTVTMCEM